MAMEIRGNWFKDPIVAKLKAVHSLVLIEANATRCRDTRISYHHLKDQSPALSSASPHRSPVSTISMGGIGEIFGAVLTGVILNAWLFGLQCVLTYQYYVNFPSDGRGTKLLVAWLGLLQLFDVIVVSKMIYYYLVTSFGIPENLNVAIWEWSLYMGLSSLSAFSVQAYYARRTHLLTKSFLLFAIILLLAFLQLGFGLATMSEAFHLVILSKFPSVTWVCVTWLAFASACDFIITIVQVVYLHRHRSGIAATNRLVNILSLYIMSTGLLTSIVALLELTTFATLGFNFVHVFLSHVMGAIYAVSFLANLDARRTVRLAKTEPGTLGQANLQTTQNADRSVNIMFKKGQVQVHSETNIESFPSDTTKFSDLHAHPRDIDLAEKSASEGSVFSNV